MKAKPENKHDSRTSRPPRPTLTTDHIHDIISQLFKDKCREYSEVAFVDYKNCVAFVDYKKTFLPSTSLTYIDIIQVQEQGKEDVGPIDVDIMKYVINYTRTAQ